MKTNDGLTGIDPSVTTTIPGEWIQDASTKRWWYRHKDGSYTKDGFEYINGKWYYFDAEGWMADNRWIQVKGAWYFAEPGGALAFNKWIQGEYFVGRLGYMQTNRLTPDGYFVGEDGKWDHREAWGLRLQKALKAAGYNPGTLDGVMGPNTLAACPTLRYDSQGEIVALLQEALKYGYLFPVDVVDGSFGKQTERAVILFQEFYGLTQDGVVGKNTWKEILRL
ncbi:MAG: peptidoglycan-binding protein [Bacillota bacterium]|nr:peptidoglycan-binding protein [Bacillota bacterium]